mgnify:CR=1 FL=1
MYHQGANAVPIGQLSGNTRQGGNAVAVGQLQGANAVAVGQLSGNTRQGLNVVAVGGKLVRIRQVCVHSGGKCV